MEGKYEFSKENTYELINRAKNHDKDALEKMTINNTGLVKCIAYKFIGMGYELDDLIQIGYIGLLKAIERFDPERGVMFSTYAVPMIMGEIKRHIRDEGKIKFNRQTKQDIRFLKQKQEEFYATKGYAPKLSDLCELMNMEKEAVISILNAADAMSSITSLDDDEAMVNISKLSSCEDDKNIDMIFIKGMISSLPEKERQIIVLRYFKDYTQQQIAKCIGISQVQVSRIEKKVLEKLRNMV